MKTSIENRNILYAEYQKEDFDGFFCCMESFFHNGYPHDDFLQKDSLHRYVDSGDLVLSVAKTRDGKIVGTSGALRSTGRFGTSVTLTLRCVSQEYQGQGVGTEQERFLFALIAKRFPDIRSIHADVTTHNTHSQNTLVHQGFTLTGLCLMQYNNHAFLPELTFDPGTCMSPSVFVKAVKKDAVTLYAPPEHRSFIRGIYDELGVPCSFVEPAPAVQTESLYHWDICRKLGASELIIDRAGTMSAQLKKEIADMIDSDCTIISRLNMSQEGFFGQYREMLAEGFVFSGIRPLRGEGECMILSHLGKHDHVDDMILPEGKEHIMNYILGGIHK